MVKLSLHVVLILLRFCGVQAKQDNVPENQNVLQSDDIGLENENFIHYDQGVSTEYGPLHNHYDTMSSETETASQELSTDAIQALNNAENDEKNVKSTDASDDQYQAPDQTIPSTSSTNELSEKSENSEESNVSSPEVHLSNTTSEFENNPSIQTENSLLSNEQQEFSASPIDYSLEHTPTVILEDFSRAFTQDLENSPSSDERARERSQIEEKNNTLEIELEKADKKAFERTDETSNDRTHVEAENTGIDFQNGETSIQYEKKVSSGTNNQRSSDLSVPGEEKSPISDLSGQAPEDFFANASNLSLIETDESSKSNKSNDSRFLSFEEWKKLKEDNQKSVPENAHNERKDSQTPIRNDSLAVIKKPEKPITSLFEDQGRVYKDKFNYASVDCAATIVKTNSDAKGAKAILTEVKDSYLLNKCSTQNKFVVVELCQDILVGSVVMANFELFSSMFKTVRFSVSDRFPVTEGWHELGTFEAQNIRDMQTFDIASPLIWARYLKIEIVTHYGNEFYCPISLVRVHGKTMMEEFKDTSNSEVSKNSEIPLPTEEFLNNTTGFESRDECKVTPYLALNEFLKDFHSNSSYCDASSYNVTTSAESSNSKPTQESIFQNIVKRLSLLETNATLSLLYVEEQSKLLSDAFFNLEHRQVKKFENLLTQLNDTMYSQVTYLERAVAKIRVDSKHLLSIQNLQSLSSIENFKKETFSFAREISFLRKVVIADTLIILALLAYVILTRESFSVEELTGRKQAVEVRESDNLKSMIRPFTARHNRSKGRRRKH